MASLISKIFIYIIIITCKSDDDYINNCYHHSYWSPSRNDIFWLLHVGYSSLHKPLCGFIVLSALIDEGLTTQGPMKTPQEELQGACLEGRILLIHFYLFHLVIVISLG